MIHLEPGHRIVADAVAMCVHSSPEKREAVDVRCSDFGCHYYVCAAPEEPHILRVSLWTRCFDAVQEQVGKSYFQEIYPGLVDSPLPEYKLTLRINLDELPSDSQEKDAFVRRIACLKRDVLGAPLLICFKALLDGPTPSRAVYAVPYREDETMWVIPARSPANDLVVVVFSICFENPVEQAIAKAFLQELEISKRQARDLATAPSVTYTQEPPYELKSLSGIDLRTAKNFVGFVSLAISKRSVEGGRLEKAVTLVEGYRAYLIYHVQATKSQLHTRIRSRSHTWLQVGRIPCHAASTLALR
uniref:Arp2/3 complex 34 kDa subunit n=1 Tax=Chrysotila carterae TaxID=13221 RepID=A0A6S9SAF1_CHRCT